MKTPKPNRVSRRYLEKRLDKVLFEYLKVKTGPFCHLQGHGCKCGGVLQPNHLITRANKRLRWDEENVIVGCEGHNAWAHFHGPEWDKLWRSLWPNRAKSLDLKRQGTMYCSESMLRILISEYEKKLKEAA